MAFHLFFSLFDVWWIYQVKTGCSSPDTSNGVEVLLFLCTSAYCIVTTRSYSFWNRVWRRTARRGPFQFLLRFWCCPASVYKCLYEYIFYSSDNLSIILTLKWRLYLSELELSELNQISIVLLDNILPL